MEHGPKTYENNHRHKFKKCVPMETETLRSGQTNIDPCKLNKIKIFSDRALQSMTEYNYPDINYM